MRRPAAALLTLLAALTIVAAPAAAATPFPDRIDLPNGWRPEGIAAGRGTTAFVGSLANGSIARVNLRTGAVDADFITGPGLPAVGLFYERANDRLWAAGGPSGQVRVYDATSGAELARVARRVAMSTRTVQRRLEEAGTSYQDVVDELRAGMARSLLRDRARSIVDVAFELGYADLKGFYRAFRRWTGTTPADWRAHQD